MVIIFLIACRRIAADRADLDKALMGENWNKSVDLLFYFYFLSRHALIVVIRSVFLSYSVVIRSLFVPLSLIHTHT